MPIVEYPFVFPSQKSTWYPQLPIDVVNTNNGNWTSGFAKIDTGANYCSIPFNTDIVEELGVSLDEKDKTKLICAGLLREDCYKCDTINIKIFKVIDVSPDDVFIESNLLMTLTPSQVVFIPGLANPILGVKGFLDDYVLTINYQLKKFSIRTPHKYRHCRICRP